MANGEVVVHSLADFQALMFKSDEATWVAEKVFWYVLSLMLHFLELRVSKW